MTEIHDKARRSISRALAMARIAAVGLVVALLVLLAWQLVRSSHGTELVTDVQAGRSPTAPAFDLPVLWARSETWPPELRETLVDGRLELGELRGYPVVINFWASWCGPCKEEAPRLVASARRHAGAVVFLGIDVQDFQSDARSFLRRFETNYASVRDGGDSTSTNYGLTGLPETYWLDDRGRIRDHHAGEISSRRLEDGIQRITE